MKDASFEALTGVLNALSNYDCNIYLENEFKDAIPENNAQKTGKLCFAALDEIVDNINFCIVLGGDGSILEAVRDTVKNAIPILGINLGRIGYMAEIEPSETEYLAKLFSDDYICDERMMLSVTHKRNGRVLFESFALNDAVVSKGSVSKVIELELYSNESKIVTYRADGVIFSTPTGSTAYSMSAGGPIIDPKLGCICVTPVCPHSLGQRPLLFSDDVSLAAKNVSMREKQLFLTLDGHENLAIELGDEVCIKKSDYKAKLIKLKDTDFYNIVKQKIRNIEE